VQVVHAVKGPVKDQHGRAIRPGDIRRIGHGNRAHEIAVSRQFDLDLGRQFYLVLDEQYGPAGD
jgi:hypothetical protein